MDREALAEHLQRPRGRGILPEDAFTGVAGGAACGDLIRVSLSLQSRDGDHVIAAVGFDASGCGTAIAAGSAVVALVSRRTLLQAARVGAGEVAGELGGLSPAKMHAAELAADALHRALGAAARLAPSGRVVTGRTLVAMSGGVDSAVAALIVAEDGNVGVGVTLELWSDPENDGNLSCCSADAVRGARELAHGLGMAHLSIDLREEFRTGVVDHWIASHRAGQTPNPCVRCNGQVRLDAMLDLASRLGAGSLVTGHYARVADDRRPLLRAAVDPTKDQSYVLAALSPDSLSRCRFPLGSMHKTEVRERARRAGLPVADRRDSQDLCFLAGTRQHDFLARHSDLGVRMGAILDSDGSVLGEHRGSHSYTIGQRHGLGLGGGRPWYVLATDPHSNTVTVGDREQLLTAEITVEGVVLHRPLGEVDAVRIRSRGARLACRARYSGGGTGEGPDGREPAVAGKPDGGRPDAGQRRTEGRAVVSEGRAVVSEGRAVVSEGRAVVSEGRAVVSERRAVVRIALERPIERTASGQLACLYRGDVIVGHGTISL